MGAVTSQQLPEGASLFSRDLEEKYERHVREIEKAERAKSQTIKEPVPKPAFKLRARDYKRKRVIGCEQEYGIMPANDWRFKNKSCGFFSEIGARIYSDCGHPEYASPESSNPLEAILYDKAGELIVAREVSALGLRLFKNNRDSDGNLYGSHESYSLKYSNMADLANFMIPFLTTRIIFAGSGCINRNGMYEISQRAGNISHLISSNTTTERSIFNTREEPLTDSSQLMRMHVISGDANLSEYALFLKYGATALMLDLFEDRKVPRLALYYPVNAIKGISLDLNHRFNVEINGFAKNRCAIDIQRAYLDLAQKAYRGRDAVTDSVLDIWDSTLDTLKADPMQLDRRLDWVIKKNLIESYRKKTGKSMFDLAVRNIDLQYHELGEKGLFNMLQQKGLVERLVNDEEIMHASLNPPSDTRAFIRGRFVELMKTPEYKCFITSVDWQRIHVTKYEKCHDCGKNHVKIGCNFAMNNPLDNYPQLEAEIKSWIGGTY